MSKKNLQLVIFDGNLMNDPVLRYSPKGTEVTTLIVANNNAYTNGTGELVETLTKFKVTVWGNLAIPCNQYLHKGSHVLVSGRLTANQKDGPQKGRPAIWTSQDGQPRADFEVKAAQVQFLDSAKKEAVKPPEGEDEIPAGRPEDEFPFEGGVS